jgi:hypothetical protein
MASIHICEKRGYKKSLPNNRAEVILKKEPFKSLCRKDPVLMKRIGFRVHVVFEIPTFILKPPQPVRLQSNGLGLSAFFRARVFHRLLIYFIAMNDIGRVSTGPRRDQKDKIQSI